MICKVINSSKAKLEDDINEWLKSGKYEITHILQTESERSEQITQKNNNELWKQKN